MVSVWALGVFALQLEAAETACATVSIEIEQQVTLERQAFDATLRVDNGLAEALEDFVVTVWVRSLETNLFLVREPNTPTIVNDLEFFNADETEILFFKPAQSEAAINISAGEGATFTYRLIPTQEAALIKEGSRYEVGADITYTVGGKIESISVEPDSILVKPLPALTLEYFLPKSVIADNPNTLVVEPTKPFYLGMRVVNSGVGDAQNLQIESFQPVLEENEQGLLVEFEVLGSSVNGSAVGADLVSNFGTVFSAHAETATWKMESSLYGRFIEARATFTHSDELGGSVTSVIDAASVYRLIGMVQANGDSIPDFLSIGDGSSGENFAEDDFKMSLLGSGTTVQELLRLHPSGLQGDGTTGQISFEYVANLSNYIDQQNLMIDGQTLSIPVSGAPASASGVNYSFLRVEDPNSGQYELTSVRRLSDGSLLPRANYQQVYELAENPDGTIDVSAAPKTYIDIFDIGNVTGSSYNNIYEVTYGQLISSNTPPVIEALPQIPTMRVGDTVAFSVNVYDADGDIIEVGPLSLPEGANFDENVSTQGDASYAQYDFVWTATAGISPFSIWASDGQDSTTASLSIHVIESEEDAVSDWLKQFGLEWSELSQDTDLDGYSNLLEYVLNLDPNKTTGQNFPWVEVLNVNGDTYLSIVADVLATVNPLDANSTSISISASVSTSLDDSAVWSVVLDDPVEVNDGFSEAHPAPGPGMVRLRWIDDSSLTELFAPRFIRLEAEYEYDDTNVQ